MEKIFSKLRIFSKKFLSAELNSPVIFYLILSLFLCKWTFVNAVENQFNCSHVKHSFDLAGVHVDVPKTPITDSSPRRTCSGNSCCTEQAEAALNAHSKQLLDTELKQTLATLSSVLKTRAQKFDEFFKKMLTTSKREFHEMFTRTYGIIYERNSYVFTDLFEQLEQYYMKGKVDLIQAMENFFNTLYQKMFTVLNAQYHFDDKYLDCVSEHMKELNPFGDVPHKLSLQLKRSFVATRTFAQALGVAGDIVNNMINMAPTAACSTALFKMMHCSTCKGYRLKSCYNYCTNVMKGCLAFHSELDAEWNNFVDAVDKVVERLLGPFNIEMVVEPIDIKISEAIMNFQENAQQVTQRVFSGCGKPTLGRRRRSSKTPGELSLETLEFESSSSSRYDNGEGGSAEGGLSLDKLVKDIRLRVKDTKQFWSRLPYQMCNSDTWSVHVYSGTGKENSCWNGTTEGRYLPQVTGDGLSNQQHNPEVPVDVKWPSSLINEQIFGLKAITSKLKNAYNGMDVEWIDIEESFGSGSGSGDGGDVDVDTEGGDDDDDSGSGMGYPTERVVRPEVVVPDSHPPGSRNDEDNRLPPIPDDTSKTRKNVTSGGTSHSNLNNRISLNRAILSYLLPVVMMWFGGAISDLVQ